MSGEFFQVIKYFEGTQSVNPLSHSSKIRLIRFQRLFDERERFIYLSHPTKNIALNLEGQGLALIKRQTFFNRFLCFTKALKVEQRQGAIDPSARILRGKSNCSLRTG